MSPEKSKRGAKNYTPQQELQFYREQAALGGQHVLSLLNFLIHQSEYHSGPRNLMGIVQGAAQIGDSEARPKIVEKWLKHSENDVAYLPFVDILVVGDPDTATDLLKNKNTRRALIQSVLNKQVGNIIASDGPDYEMMRELTMNHLNRSAVEGYLQVIGQEINSSVEEWGQTGQEENFNLTAEMNQLFRRLVPRTLMGGLEFDNELSDKIAELVPLAARIEAANLTTPPSKRSKVPGAERYQQVKSEVMSGLVQLFQEVQAQPDADNYGIVSGLVKMVEDGKFPYEQAAAEFIGLYTAAYETTANAITHAVVMLGKHPEVMQKLQAEQDALPKDIPFSEKIQKLDYAEKVFMEAVRLFAPVQIGLRELTAAVEIDGKEYAPGTFVLLAIQKILMNPDAFPNPEEFNPDRYDDPTQRKALIAWIQGDVHMCKGMLLSLVEGRVALGAIAEMFNIEVHPDVVPEPVYEASLQAQDLEGKLRLTPRE